jgi:hypothetical protein
VVPPIRRRPRLPVEEKVQEVIDDIIASIDPDDFGEAEEAEPYVPNFVFYQADQTVSVDAMIEPAPWLGFVRRFRNS